MMREGLIHDDEIPLQQRQRGQAALIRTAMTASVLWGTALGTTLPTQFLLSLGAREFYIGVLSTVLAAAPLGALFGVWVIPRLGKVGLVIWGRTAVVPFLVGMIVMAAVGWRGGWAIAVAIVLFACMNLPYLVANTSWWPLLQDNLGPDQMGTFFARMRTRLRAVEVGTPLIVGLGLGADPPLQKFLLPFGMALVALLVGTEFIRKVPEIRAVVPPVGLWLRLRLAARGAAVRKYMIYIFIFNVASSLLGVFALVMLTASERNPHGLPQGFVVCLSAVAAVGNVLGLRLWANMVDRHGGRSVLAISLVGLAMLGSAWLVLPAGHVAMIVWAVAYYLAWGFLDGGSLMGRTWAMLQAIPKVYQADGFTLIMLVSAAGGALGGLAGGACFDYLTTATRGGFSLLGLDIRQLYLCAAEMSLLVAYMWARRLTGHEKQTPARKVLVGMFAETAPQ